MSSRREDHRNPAAPAGRLRGRAPARLGSAVVRERDALPLPWPLPRGQPKRARPFLGPRSVSKQGQQGGQGIRPWGDLEAAGHGLVTPGALRVGGGGVPIGPLTPTSAEAGVPLRHPVTARHRVPGGGCWQRCGQRRQVKLEGQRRHGSMLTAVSAHPGHGGPASAPTGMASSGGFAARCRALPFAGSVVVATSLTPGGPRGIPTSPVREQTPLGTRPRAGAMRTAAAVCCHGNGPRRGPLGPVAAAPGHQAAGLSARSGSDPGHVVAAGAPSSQSACDLVGPQLGPLKHGPGTRPRPSV